MAASEAEIFETLEALEAPVPHEKRLEDWRDVIGDVDHDANEHHLPVLTQFLTSMCLTREKFLRATPAHRITRRAGRALRQGTQVSFRDSRKVKEISKFISHSWQASPLLKTLTLHRFYNLTAAALAGTLGAMLGTILFSCGLLPGFERAPRFGTEPLLQGLWSLCLGQLLFVLVLIFRAPRDMVFLDRLCIDQEKHRAKIEGVLNIGACLKHSKALLVIWDVTYCQRLWCLFEMAAFLKTHEDAVIIEPVSLTVYCLGTFFFNAVWCGSVVLPNNSQVTAPIVLVLAACAYGWFFGEVLLRYSQSLQSLKAQLQNFRFAEAEVYCCSVGHKARNGEDLLCDRKVLQKCVQAWFGSMEDFEQSVQTRVRDALSHHFGGNFCPPHLLIIASLPLLWAHMDFAAAWFLQNEMMVGLGMLILGLAGTFIAPFAVPGVVLACMRRMPRSYPALQKLAASAIYMVANLITQGSVQLLFSSLGVLPGSLVFSALLVLPNVLVWEFCSRIF
ncbi:unnamed protein product [Effrenium voratum]|uniref:Uncharacterized protein n=1 Tax=Effrenium voratum TaxID=2562239 RepID=A0AA36N7Z8_9DINO|nr:unnamed protein product [Effrenium voratum]CAJ1441679.1 unnamed protein product [Effrenium voratum]